MSRLEKGFMTTLLVLIIGTIIFWDNIMPAFNSNKGVIEDEPRNEKNDKKGKDVDKQKTEKVEASSVFFSEQAYNSLKYSA
jgi:hypothetical protein